MTLDVLIIEPKFYLNKMIYLNLYSIDYEVFLISIFKNKLNFSRWKIVVISVDIIFIIILDFLS